MRIEPSLELQETPMSKGIPIYYKDLSSSIELLTMVNDDVDWTSHRRRDGVCMYSNEGFAALAYHAT